MIGNLTALSPDELYRLFVSFCKYLKKDRSYYLSLLDTNLSGSYLDHE